MKKYYYIIPISDLIQLLPLIYIYIQSFTYHQVLNEFYVQQDKNYI